MVAYDVQLVDTLTSTSRGEGGFGSTTGKYGKTEGITLTEEETAEANFTENRNPIELSKDASAIPPLPPTSDAKKTNETTVPDNTVEGRKRKSSNMRPEHETCHVKKVRSYSPSATINSEPTISISQS